MFWNFKLKSILYAILAVGITINTLNSAAPKLKKEDPKLKKEKKIYEKLKSIGIFPDELSSIIASYAAPKHILLNFLIPNLQGNLEVHYAYATIDEKEINKILEKYPKLKSDKKITRRGFNYSYAPKEELSHDLLILEKQVSLPLAPKMLIPILKIENLLIESKISIILKIGDKDKEEEYSLFLPFDNENLKSIGKLGGNFSIKLIDDFKNECKDKLETIVTSTSNPKVALCFKKLL